MCKKNKGCGRRIDSCMTNIIHYLNISGIKTLACCCGHKKYPMSIIVQHSNGKPFDICSYKFIPRNKRFYKRDPKGFYYIPEAIQ